MPRAARPALLLPALLLLARVAAAEGPDDTWCAPFQRGPGCEDVLLDACVAATDRAQLLLGESQPKVTAVLDGCQAPYQVENRVQVLVPKNAAAAVREYASRYEAATGTAVEVRVMKDLTAGNLPSIVKALKDNAGDVVVFDSKLLPGLVDLPGDGTPDTALTDLTDIMGADKGFAWEDIFPFLRRFTASYRAHTSRGSRVYAVPLSVDLVYLFYRRDLLEAAGLDVPATWDEYLRVAAALDGVEEGGRRVHGSCVHSNCAPARYWLDIVSSLTQARGTTSGSLLAPQDLSMLFDSVAGTRAFDILNATRGFHVGDGGETCPDDSDAAFNSGSEFDLALMAGNEHYRRVPSFARGECALALADRGQLLLMTPPEGEAEVDFQWSVAQVPCSPVVLNRTAEDPSSAAALAECAPNDSHAHAGSKKHRACPYAPSRGSYAGLNCAPQSHGSILASINQFSPKQATAWSFLSFMGGKEVALEGLAERGFVGEFLFRTSTARAYEKVIQERLLTEMDPAERQTTEADAQILRLLGKTMNDPNVVQQPNYPGMTELIHELTKTLKALFEGGNAARGLSRFAAEWNVTIDNFGRVAYTHVYQQSIGYTGPRTATAGGGASSNLGLLVGLPVALVFLVWAVMATWAVWRARRRRRHLRRPPGPPVGDAHSGLTPPLTTFVFTDIQNSTKLWESDPDAMRAAAQLHNKVLRGEMLVCGGTLSATEGDGWIVCFHSPTDALAFCLRSQRALLAAPWPPALLALEGMGEVRGPAFADYGATTIHEELGPASASFAEVLDAWGGGSRPTRKRGRLLAWLAGAGGTKSRPAAAKSARATAKKVRSSTGSVGDSPVLFRGLRVR